MRNPNGHFILSFKGESKQSYLINDLNNIIREYNIIVNLSKFTFNKRESL